MISTVRIIELVVFYILSLSVGYLFLFAIASKLFRTILKLLFEEVVIEILVIAILIKQMNIK